MAHPSYYTNLFSVGSRHSYISELISSRCEFLTQRVLPAIKLQSGISVGMSLYVFMNLSRLLIPSIWDEGDEQNV